MLKVALNVNVMFNVLLEIQAWCHVCVERNETGPTITKSGSQVWILNKFQEIFTNRDVTWVIEARELQETMKIIFNLIENYFMVSWSQLISYVSVPLFIYSRLFLPRAVRPFLFQTNIKWIFISLNWNVFIYCSNLIMINQFYSKFNLFLVMISKLIGIHNILVKTISSEMD